MAWMRYDWSPQQLFTGLWKKSLSRFFSICDCNLQGSIYASNERIYNALILEDLADGASLGALREINEQSDLVKRRFENF